MVNNAPWTFSGEPREYQLYQWNSRVQDWIDVKRRDDMAVCQHPRYLLYLRRRLREAVVLARIRLLPHHLPVRAERDTKW